MRLSSAILHLSGNSWNFTPVSKNICIHLVSWIATIETLKATETMTAVKTLLKNEFASFQAISSLFGAAQFIKCRQLFLELNS